MFRCLDLSGCWLSKKQLNVIHPNQDRTGFSCKECNKCYQNQELLESHLCQCHIKSESNTTTPKAGSFDDHHNHFDFRKDDSIVMDKFYLRGPTPTASKSFIMEQSYYGATSPSPTRLDSPFKLLSKTSIISEKSEMSGYQVSFADPLSKIVETIKDKPVEIRVKLESKYIQSEMKKKVNKKFLISETWMQKYGAYLSGKTKEEPGPIDNRELKRKLCENKAQSGSLYAVNEAIWKFLKILYGGGPEIAHSPDSATPSSLRPQKPKMSDKLDEASPNRARQNKKAMTYIQKPRLSNTDFCLTPIRLFYPIPYFPLVACIHLLIGVSDFLKYINQEKNSEIIKYMKFLKGFQEIIDAHLKEHKVYTPSLLGSLFKEHAGAKRLDPYIFLTRILEGIQNEVKTGVQNRSTKSLVFETNTLSRNPSGLAEVFGGIIQDVTKCLGCGHKSLKKMETLSLSLPVVQGRTKTIEDCLALFQKEKELDDLQLCDSCHQNCLASKQSMIYKCPRNLIINLERFSSKSRKNIHEFVNYLPENFGIRGLGDNETNQYNLIGVITHSSSIEDEQYICYTKRGENWFLCSDEEIKEIHAKKAIQQDACILLYQKAN